ncbi:MAG TPA: serine hydrolase domain-containing protein [Caulobacter sp.]|nr:serine hydrolase domain-containing protein [Caulobacter sp.]
MLASLGSAASAQVPKLDLGVIFGSIAPKGPGCGVGVSVPNSPALIAAYGQADLEHPEPLTAATIFETGSLAKQFTAAAMLLLVQDGKLSLDDDIRRYLPEMPDYGTPITIRHLLTHTSGLREQWSLMALTGNGPGTQAHTMPMILDLASRQKGLNFRPGAEFLYTNTNYALAAMIIERVSGQSLQRFTDQRLFQPLGMRETRWREDFRTVVPNRAMAYAPAGDSFIANMPFTSVYGNGGLLTTVGDLLRWNAFLDRPSDLPGGQALAAALQTPGRLNDGAPLDYALGLEVTRDHGRRLVSHSGSTGGYKTWLGRYPDEGVSIAVLCNNGGIDPVEMGERVARQALLAAGHAEAVVSAPKAVAAAQAPTTDLAPYQGLFRNPVTGELIRLQAADGQLTLTRGSAEVLVALSGNRFQRPDGDIVSFARSGSKTTEVMLSHGETRQRFFAVQAAKSDSATLAAYVGTYYSAELDTRISVIRQNDVLVMRQPFAVEWILNPGFADGFTTRLRGTTTFVFDRAADGRIKGFSAWANGVRNLAFIKQ